MRESIEAVHADVVLLQEVAGGDEEGSAQLEYLADRLWPHFAYGKNAVYSGGHHGNAILSKHPILSWENQDVSPNRLERRGLLHATIAHPRAGEALHVVCVHLGLFESGRRDQIDRLSQRVSGMVPPQAPLVIGGDFNDWRETGGPELESRLGVREAFRDAAGRSARTFPAWMPVLRLDRLYFRGLACDSAELVAGEPWSALSDHLPIVARLRFPER
jgi:endonuclease/exonuclease/phosphatase family metal-dependent hydrolase